MSGSKQIDFMTMLTGADAAICIRRISYDRTGAMVSAMAARNRLFTDEPKNSDKTLRYWFYGKDCELAAEIKQ